MEPYRSIIKYSIIFIVLAVVFQQATARSRNLAIAETRQDEAARIDAALQSLRVRAENAEEDARIATELATVRAREDSARIAELQGRITAMTQRADSIGSELSDHLAELDPSLARDFQDYQAEMVAALQSSQEETRVEREAKEEAEALALLWQRSSESRDEIIQGQREQIRQLELGLSAALDAVDPGWWPTLKADWWVAVAGFGLGVVVTQ